MKPNISDHAVLRYLERVIGVDIEFYRQEIVERLEPLFALGVNSIASEGVVYKFTADGVCTTVVGASSNAAYFDGMLRSKGIQPHKGRDRSGIGRHQRRHRGE